MLVEAVRHDLEKQSDMSHLTADFATREGRSCVVPDFRNVSKVRHYTRTLRQSPWCASEMRVLSSPFSLVMRRNGQWREAQFVNLAYNYPEMMR